MVAFELPSSLLIHFIFNNVAQKLFKDLPRLNKGMF